MSRIPAIDPAQAAGQTADLFAAVKAKLGLVPNLARVLGQSPAALQAYLQFSGSLAGGSLRARVREQIALAVAEANACDYCLSAHTLLGKGAGLSPEAIAAAREGRADDAHVNAILGLARALVAKQGRISDEEVALARAAGVTDAELVETVGHVALNTFTNYLNHAAQTVVDFPLVRAAA